MTARAVFCCGLFRARFLKFAVRRSKAFVVSKQNLQIMSTEPRGTRGKNKKTTGKDRTKTALQIELDQYKKKYGEFMPGNRKAEKWTEEIVLMKLYKMLDVVAKDEATGETADNPVRANTVKLLKEVCLCVGINGVIFAEWQRKFCHKTIETEQGKQENNGNYSPAVSKLIQIIKDICECRLVYSGGRMDEFVLKNHYEYVEQIDHTTKGEAIQGTQITAPVVQIIEQS